MTTIVGDCVIDIMPRSTGIELEKLAGLVIEIGRTVGCSAYENDFTLPEVPEEWLNQPAGWYTEGLPPYIPELSDPEPPAES